MDSDLPFVTVIAPCRNEHEFIREAIESILYNDYPNDKIEILIVDGMSTDGTRDIVQDMSRAFSQIQLIDNPDKIVPVAMNIGVKKAKGEFVIRIDCHAKFAPNYIRSCIEVLNRTKADNVGGYMETISESTSPIAVAISKATSSRFGVGNSAFRTGGVEIEADTVPFGAFKREAFERFGHYDERLVRNQDIEMNSRIRRLGGKIIISPSIKLRYVNRSTYKGIWQQSFNNGVWNPYTIWLVGGGLFIRHFIPMIFVLSLLSLSTISLFNSRCLLLLTVELIVYIGAAIFFALKASEKRYGSACRVLWAFFVLHIAYGLASLWGVLTVLFRFPSRNAKSVGRVLADRK